MDSINSVNKEFSPIKRWPTTKHHLRNVEICLHVARGLSCKDVGAIYNLCRYRISIIYRILMGYLYSNKYNIPYSEAVNNKKYYYCKESLEMIEKYYESYKKWLNKANA